MNGLIRFSMNKVAAMVILIALLVAGGLYSTATLKMETIPDISFPVVMIQTSYPAPPMDVMDEVTKPIEDKIANIQGLDTLSSTSSDNISSVVVQFKQGYDVKEKKTELEGLLQEVALPAGASTPKVLTFGFSSQPAYYLTLYAGEGMSQMELNKLYEDSIKPSLEGVNGIDHVNSIGVSSTSLDILLDADALSVFNLSAVEVTSAIQSALTDGAVGSVELDGKSQMARVTGDLNSIYGLRNLEFATSTGQTVLLQDLGDVQAVNESKFIARYNNQPALGIRLYKMSEANAVDFSNEVNTVLADWETKQPAVTFQKIYDGADEVRKSISGILKEGFIGIALASLMILLFLRNIRMTLIVLVSIPLSILITLIMMSSMNITLNIMTLGGMFIAIGRIVDDSIVVIENIYSNLEKAQERGESVIIMATRQVSMAITSSTLVTAGVFLPLAVVGGIVGQMFRPFALTVSCALLASLVVALTVIPMMTKLLVLRSRKQIKQNEHAHDGKVTRLYERILVWCLSNRIKTLLMSLVMLVVTMAITIPNLAVNFLPSSGPEKLVFFQVKYPYETSLESNDMQSQEIEKMLLDAKDSQGGALFTFVESLVGYADSDDTVPYTTSLTAEISEAEDATLVLNNYVELIKNQLPQGTEVTGEMASGGGGLNGGSFSYVLKGDDQQLLEQGAALVKGKMKEFPELTKITDTLSDAKTEISITVSQTKARELGLNPAEVRDSVRMWLAEQRLGDIRFDNVLYSTVVKLRDEDKGSLEKLGKMPISSPTAGIVYLQEVAKVEEVQAPAALSRESRSQVVKMSATIDAADQTEVSTRVAAALDAIELPTGVSTEIQGVSEDIAESFTQLFMAMAVSIAIVYFILVLCFGNASTPFAILFSLPLAIIGGLLGLLVTNESINITSLIGFMMLIGIVVTNAIVLLDRAQQLRHEGFSVRHALVEAGRVRLRPIIMTAGATIVAMIPLAMGTGEGVLISKGLAVVVIGGLITSTLLTLVVVPVVYEMLEAISNKLFRKGKGQAAPVDFNKPANLEG
ncbi:Multidrug efflux pump subunit AcrB [Paenibacillus algorifonticola]|uniref:Multidrug efflux pump subunit AcrB n=1 Tax=Paenibacillus algorifonticola TaxID=684063 RepID=A0A1I2J175_9BACL|nr:efflux RND transporter permease subunit [Paenibacillus algorifonticola]SFF46491.1 Multidrug efflux pump subunit AcrB [Paenibacillus algorifonticola]